MGSNRSAFCSLVFSPLRCFVPRVGYPTYTRLFPDLGDPQRRIGIIFRGIRYKHHLTQVQVAQRLGLDQSDVSKIEKGKRAIGKALAKKVQHEFGIDYRRLL